VQVARASRSFGALKFRRNTWYHPGEWQRVLVASGWWVGGGGESALGAKTLKQIVFQYFGKARYDRYARVQGRR